MVLPHLSAGRRFSSEGARSTTPLNARPLHRAARASRSTLRARLGAAECPLLRRRPPSLPSRRLIPTTLSSSSSSVPRCIIAPTPCAKGYLLLSRARHYPSTLRSTGTSSSSNSPPPPSPQKLPVWIPFTLIKGGTSANVLVKTWETSGGDNDTVKNTLTRNVGQALYKDYAKICNTARSQFPQLKHVKEFEFGMKIRDKVCFLGASKLSDPD